VKKNDYGVQVGKPQAKRQLERPRSRWENDIKMDLSGIVRLWTKNTEFSFSLVRDIGRGGMDWIHLAQIGTCGRPF
jgi:hypothetical protein